MRRYNILWIDDECEKLKSLIISAELKGIDIIPFSTAKEGMEAFEKDLYKWDGVILDAKGWNKSSDEAATTEGMYNLLDKMTELKHKRVVPIFIYSGQGDLLSDDQFQNSLRGRKIYKKTLPKDLNQLLSDIITEADKLPETQIRHKYQDVIGTFRCIDEELVRMLLIIENDNTKEDDIFNSIRKILEWIMCYSNTTNVLPIPFKNTNLAECSKFLGSKEMTKFVPIHIQRSFHACVEIANNGSHRLGIDKIVREGNAPYLIRSTVFELLNIIFWCKSLSSIDKSIIEQIKSLPSCIEGTIEQDEYGNYHFNNYLLNFKDMKAEDVGKKIRINKSSDNTDSRTKDCYHFFCISK